MVEDKVSIAPPRRTRGRTRKPAQDTMPVQGGRGYRVADRANQAVPGCRPPQPLPSAHSLTRPVGQERPASDRSGTTDRRGPWSWQLRIATCTKSSSQNLRPKETTTFHFVDCRAGTAVPRHQETPAEKRPGATSLLVGQQRGVPPGPERAARCRVHPPLPRMHRG
jgi:hypothetical protein